MRHQLINYLNKGDCNCSGGDQHRTLADQELHAVEAPVLKDRRVVDQIRIDVAGVGQLNYIRVGARNNALPVVLAIDSTTFQLKFWVSEMVFSSLFLQKFYSIPIILTNSCIMFTESSTYGLEG